MCILSGIGVSQVLTTYMKNLDVSRPDKKNKKQQDSTYPIKNEVSVLLWWKDWIWTTCMYLLYIKKIFFFNIFYKIIYFVLNPTPSCWWSQKIKEKDNSIVH